MAMTKREIAQLAQQIAERLNGAPQEELLPLKEAARILGLPEPTLRLHHERFGFVLINLNEGLAKGQEPLRNCYRLKRSQVEALRDKVIARAEGDAAEWQNVLEFQERKRA